MSHYKIIFGIVSLALFSCNTYYQNTRLVQEYFQKSNFRDAVKVVNHTKFYFKPKNELLYHLETGVLLFFNSDFKGAIDHFNMADFFVEDRDTRTQNASDIAKEILWNSASSTYKGEYFERFMIHYYKIMSFLALNDNEAARVEAQRMDIRINQLKDITDGKNYKKYKADAFAYIMEGLVYERMHEYNEAFIAYRNAYEIFEASKDGKSNNVEIPNQLYLDLARMSKMAGFEDEYQNYVSRWNLLEKDIFPKSPYELVLFWENGLVPVKVQRNYSFIAIPVTESSTLLYNNNLNLTIPFPDTINMNGFSIKDIGALTIALPKLVERKPMISSAKLYMLSLDSDNGEESHEYKLSLISDIVALEQQSMKDRQYRDIPIALTRLILGKITELSLRLAAKKSNDPNNALGMGLASSFIGLFNISKEKADTRSWLTLPAKIHYSRIPINKGENHFSMKFVDLNGHTQEYKFSKSVDNEGIYIHSIRTPQSLPPDPLNLSNL